MVLSKRVRLVNDYNSGSKTFLEPAELALSLVVMERVVRLSWEDIDSNSELFIYYAINKSIKLLSVLYLNYKLINFLSFIIGRY